MTDDIVVHKTSMEKSKIIEIIQNIFSDQNRNKEILEIAYVEIKWHTVSYKWTKDSHIRN